MVNTGEQKITTLSLMKKGSEGEIIDIQGGREMHLKLDSLGIRIGKNIKKISGQLFHGPVIFEINGNQLALGYKIAEKIEIKLE